MIEVSDQLEAARLYLSGIPGAAERAVAHAMNGAVRDAREEAVRLASERYAVKPVDLRARITLTTARAPDKLEASIVARSGSTKLGYFPHSPTAGGTGGTGKPALTATVLRTNTKSVKDAFIAVLGGKPRIVTRTGEKTASGKSQLKTLFTIPLAEMLGVEGVRPLVEDFAAARFEDKLGAEIDRELARPAP